MRERLAIYPGSFDPPTYGHLDLVERAVRIFDRVIVAVAYNREKGGLFNVEERVGMLREITGHLPNVEIDAFVGLTVDYARRQDAIALVRGLRVVSDFELELTMAITNQKLMPELDTVCLMPSERHLLVSSRLVREIAEFGGDISEFVPVQVQAHLRKKIAENHQGEV